MRSLKKRLEKLGVNNENANDYVEYCYDLIMHLVRARLLLDGYSASGQGAHEAEVSYLRIMGFNEKDVQFADQMRYFRNGIVYYGTSLDAEYAEKTIEFEKKVVPAHIKNFILRTTGMNIGKEVCIPHDIYFDPYFPELIILEDGSLVGGGSSIYTHKIEKKKLILVKCVLKERTMI